MSEKEMKKLEKLGKKGKILSLNSHTSIADGLSTPMKAKVKARPSQMLFTELYFKCKDRI
jgi:hypothetical protein